MNAKFSGKRLRELRKRSIPKITQLELADMLGVCRETIVAIETEKEGSMNALPVNLIRQWYDICQNRISSEHRHSFQSYLTKFWGISGR